ncbi:adenylate kinase 8-like [Rhopilema esculentum]|uniref:adenylate kinase 8-like n=1 Tax=Rhopilema esculentum TaxID=499914 RepID=UPI0031DB6B50|eukprot:gene10301-18999_t
MDATKRPLLIPPEFSVYAEKHGIFQIYEKLIQKLVIHQPADPVQFMIQQLEEPEDDAPMIIIHGPPGSGKRSLTKMVADKLNVVHLSREILFGGKADSQDSEILSSTLIKRLQEKDCTQQGWVLEGLPENRQQALALQGAGVFPKHFVILFVPDTVLIERVMGKRIDPITGDVYHTTFDPPNNPDILRRLEIDPNSQEDVMIKRLLEYHRTIPGIMSCFEHVSKRVDADQPMSDVFVQVMSFLRTKRRTVAPHTPRVILLGPTGSGKSVQASLLASKYQLVNVCSDDIVKQALADDSDLGQSLQPYIERGVTIPDDLVLKIITNRLGRLDAVKRGWVLHGFPKTRSQCDALASAGYEPNRVIFLDAPTDTILERLTLRAVDPITGERYHLLYAPPRTGEIKNRLHTHPEDEESEVLARLSEYQAHHEDLQDNFREGQRVNADQDLQTVFECIESIIVNPLPN